MKARSHAGPRSRQYATLGAFGAASDAALRAIFAAVMILPAAEPPSDRRANAAVGLAPVFVAVVFALIVSGMIAFDTGLAIFLACTAWVVYEMVAFQRAVDAYHQQWTEAGAPWSVPAASDAPAGDARRARVSARGTLQFEPSRL